MASPPPSHAVTTPDLASPRLTREPPLQLRSRLEIIAGLALTSLGLVMVGIAIVRALLRSN